MAFGFINHERAGQRIGSCYFKLFFFFFGHIFLGVRVIGRRISFPYIRQKRGWTIPAFTMETSPLIENILVVILPLVILVILYFS